MAAFFTNVCQWPSCGKKCSSLLELIDHIESSHIDSDRASIERREQLTSTSMSLAQVCTSLSYINRFFLDTAADGRKSNSILAELGISSATPPPATTVATSTSTSVAPSPQKRKKLPASRRGSSALAATQAATGASSSSAATGDTERDGGDADNGDSDDSWTYQDTISSDEIMKLMSLDGDPDKPFICPVQGCGKRYKNVNGMKYHARNGHKTEKKVKKMHKCACGKSYRSSSSLRQHQANHHPAEVAGALLDSTMLTPTTTSGSTLGPLASQVPLTPASSASGIASSLPSRASVSSTPSIAKPKPAPGESQIAASLKSTQSTPAATKTK